jgi:hypothetical protein
MLGLVHYLLVVFDSTLKRWSQRVYFAFNLLNLFLPIKLHIFLLILLCIETFLISDIKRVHIFILTINLVYFRVHQINLSIEVVFGHLLLLLSWWCGASLDWLSIPKTMWHEVAAVSWWWRANWLSIVHIINIGVQFIYDLIHIFKLYIKLTQNKIRHF